MQRLVSFFLPLLLALGVQAQVEVRLLPSQETYLVGEQLKVGVQIINFTGRTLTLGNGPGWIQFAVESVDGGIVNRLQDAPETGEFKLDTSLKGTVYFDLQPLFDLTQSGRYRLSATISVDSQTEVVSQIAHFDITNGSRMWDREFGLPSEDGQSTVERRKYIVQQANYHRSIQLYLRITDSSEGRTFKVVSLGKTVNSTRPQFAVDKESHLHILHQGGIHDFSYHTINYLGEIQVRQNYLYTDTRPMLRVNSEGEVAVFGGERRLTNTDIPARARPLTAAPLRDDANK
jgi:hypothetical protein